jgi:dihydrolipoamide dehydrogenase
VPETNFDILIIGAGPGGYVAAIRAAQLGFKTGIVEREHLGGICLNWGCIPTKALLRTAEIYRYMQHAKEFGLSVEKIGFDTAAIVARSRAIAKRLADGVGFLMKKHKITVIDGSAHLTKPGEVKVEGKGAGTYAAKHVIVATGARPRVLAGIEPDKELIWT